MFYNKRTKVPILGFGIIFFLAGTALLSIGAVCAVTFNSISKGVPQSYNLYLNPALTLGAGSSLILLTLIGSCAAFSNNKGFVISFYILLTLVCLFQVSLAIFMFLCSQDDENLSKEINNTLTSIFSQLKDINFINLIQTEMHCCGTFAPNFWNETMNKPFPESCCVDGSCTQSFQDGCQRAIYSFLITTGNVLGLILFAFSGTEIVAIVVAIVLSREVKKKGCTRLLEEE